jgi:hypothetical protein
VIPGQMQRPNRFARGDSRASVSMFMRNGSRQLRARHVSRVEAYCHRPRRPPSVCAHPCVLDSAALWPAMIGIHYRGTYSRRISGALTLM